MTKIFELRTPRLSLRQWRAADLPRFAALNADPEVMRYFPAPLSAAESDALAERCRGLIEERGWGVWVAEETTTGSFAGVVGLHVPTAPLPFAPCVEIAWRFARESWGRGLAAEGARAALEFGFDQLRLPEIVSFTSVHNTRSEAVMRRLGLERAPETFLHPSVADGHWLQEHCLYRGRRPSLSTR